MPIKIREEERYQKGIVKFNIIEYETKFLVHQYQNYCSLDKQEEFYLMMGQKFVSDLKKELSIFIKNKQMEELRQLILSKLEREGYVATSGDGVHFEYPSGIITLTDGFIQGSIANGLTVNDLVDIYINVLEDKN